MIEETIARAKKLRHEDALEASQELLINLLDENLNDPLVLYEVGGSYDVLGEEKEAIPYYQKAIVAGLDGDDLQECLVCLGSSLRNVGNFDEAIEVLEEATEHFPENNSGKAFLALAYYSDGREDEAVKLLLELLLNTTKDKDILAYADPLDYYKDNLDEVWDE
ncbi:MAG: tetratricopeptide repeat protein [Chloroflexi bacterium]|nr:tetratricopeptide repeat protein [Chloroflexota bacterium]